MILIPVIDILHGEVVRALRGDRASYRPIVSPLCRSSDPVTVSRILCTHCASDRLYVADLDALQGGAVQVAVLQALLDAQPGLQLWIDAGLADANRAEALRDALGSHADRVVPVFGSESIASAEALDACFAGAAGSDAVLSLDRRDGRRLDAAGAWEAPARWPRRVIVMTLERVGADTGPDLATLADVQARSPATEFFGAGGIRGPEDLRSAAAAGAAGWLVASALHDLRIPAVGR